MLRSYPASSRHSWARMESYRIHRNIPFMWRGVTVMESDSGGGGQWCMETVVRVDSGRGGQWWRVTVVHEDSGGG